MRWVDLWEHPRADWLAVSRAGKKADESADQWDFYWVVKTVDETACCWAGTLDCARVERKAATRVFEWVELQKIRKGKKKDNELTRRLTRRLTAWLL